MAKSSLPKTNPVFERLGALVGKWEMEASSNGVPLARASADFEWFEGHAFLIQHTKAEEPLPTTPKVWIDNNPNPLVVIIGFDDESQMFYYVYSDARGVRRVYQMSLEGRTWKIWGRAGATFFQRFEGEISPDNHSITGKWERSEDGKMWETDFDVKYTRRDHPTPGSTPRGAGNP